MAPTTRSFTFDLTPLFQTEVGARGGGGGVGGAGIARDQWVPEPWTPESRSESQLRIYPVQT